MSVEFTNYLSTAIVAVLGIVSAFSAYLVSAINNKKKLKEVELANIELKKEQAELQLAIYNNSYTICPFCGEKIYIKDMVFRKDEIK